MEDSSNKRKLSRRSFLETGVTGTVGIALGVAASSVLLPEKEGEEQAEMVKMLTPEGKLVLVDKKHLPQSCGKPVAVSNQELQEWMKTEKR